MVLRAETNETFQSDRPKEKNVKEEIIPDGQTLPSREKQLNGRQKGARKRQHGRIV